MDELIKLDSTFSLPNFITKVDNIYVMLLTSVMTNNLNRVSHYISDDVYKKYESLLKKLDKENVIEMFDELNVKSTEVTDVEILDDEYRIKVRLVSRFMHYKIDKDTRKFVSGNNSHRIEVENTLIFSKKRETLSLNNVRKCKKCGANMDLNNTGICSFCGYIFELDNYDWILVDIVD